MHFIGMKLNEIILIADSTVGPAARNVLYAHYYYFEPSMGIYRFGKG